MTFSTASDNKAKDREEPRNDKSLRVLVVTDVYPWPSRDGYRLRIQQLIRSLAGTYAVDLFAAIREDPRTVSNPPEGLITRESVERAPEKHHSAVTMIRSLFHSTPRRILGRDWADARARLHDFVVEPYDAVWYCHADSYKALGNRKFGPPIVDLDNLEDRIGIWPHIETTTKNALSLQKRIRATLENLARSLIGLREAQCWRRLQSDVVKSANLSVVCSVLDQERLGRERVAVIPNGYLDPGSPPTSTSTNNALLMVGRFSYGPNLEGAFWFATEILPLLRDLVANLEVRFVGRHDGNLDPLAQLPNVSIVGEVINVADELRSARAAMVPLRKGSGTRIKVIEALAFGLPVITTTIGCEGLPIENGIDALVKDDARSFAESCAQVLTDDDLCHRLKIAGRALFLKSFSETSISTTIVNATRQAKGC